jgi:hypothetical protein
MNKDITALRHEIHKTQNKLIKSEFNENFGQKEVIRLKDKFINISEYSQDENAKREMITWFRIWCENYTPNS